MFEVTNKRNMAIPTAVVAAVLMLCAAVLVCSPMSDATGEDLEGFGEVNEIAIAPGYSWSYTATFPSDLEAGTVLTFEVNELNTNATIDGHNVSVIIPSDFSAGAYNLVLKAEHADSRTSRSTTTFVSSPTPPRASTRFSAGHGTSPPSGWTSSSC